LPVSKAFTKDDATDEPLVVVPRPPLPAGVPNYVTPRGLAALRDERRQLDAGRAPSDLRDGDAERASAAALLHARGRDLDERIASAVLVEGGPQPRDRVRFGARVTVRAGAGVERHYEIVGVDEADVAHGRVAFVAPVASALLGRRVGEVVTLKTPRGEEELEVVAIE
jgi:transcription elongation factor GreB